MLSRVVRDVCEPVELYLLHASNWSAEMAPPRMSEINSGKTSFDIVLITSEHRLRSVMTSVKRTFRGSRQEGIAKVFRNGAGLLVTWPAECFLYRDM
jgi:hypothetical protein